MKKTLVKVLCVVLVCISGNAYAENSESYTWEWDYESKDLAISSATLTADMLNLTISHNGKLEYDNLSLDLMGCYQRKNILTVLAAFDVLRRKLTVSSAFTDVDANRENAVSVYPNPAIDFLMVEAEGESQVTIISCTGAVVLKTTVSSMAKIDISAFPEGTYTVIVAGNNGDVHYEKIVKY